MSSKVPVKLNPLALSFIPGLQPTLIAPVPLARIHQLATQYLAAEDPSFDCPTSSILYEDSDSESPSPTLQESQEDSPTLFSDRTAHTSAATSDIGNETVEQSDLQSTLTPSLLLQKRALTHENFFITKLIDRWKSSPVNQKVWAFYQSSQTSDIVILKTDQAPFLEWTTTPIIDETLEEISERMNQLGYTKASEIPFFKPYRTLCAELGTNFPTHQINYLTAVLPNQSPISKGDCCIFGDKVVKVVTMDLGYAMICDTNHSSSWMQIPLAELKKLNSRFSLAFKISC